MNFVLRILFSYTLLCVMVVSLVPLELFGEGVVCFEQTEKINGEESDGEANGECEEDNLNDKGELSDALLSLIEIGLEHRLHTLNAPWLNHLWENNQADIVSPPPELLS